MHIVMKKDRLTMRYLSFILFLLIGLGSCDTREDWFAKEGEGATFIIRSYKSFWKDEEKYEFKNDTVYSDNYRVVEYNVKVDEVHLDNHDHKVNYKSECVHLDIEGFGGKVKRTNMDVNVTTDLPEPHLVDLEDNWYYFINFDGATATSIDTTAPVLNTAHMIMELEDVFRNKFYCHVKINCLGNITPIPVLEIKNVEGNTMEKTISLSKSYDKDGSVEKYEYCIDGEIRDYDFPIYDCDPTGVPAGKGAYGGTYITSTEQSEIKHAFQKEGSHVVYYRCMDNLGLWSLWYNALITVKK